MFVELNNTRLHCEIAGEGTPIVFIHAGIVDQRMWDDQFNHFAQSYRVLRYDVRGYGQSPNPEGAYYAHEELRALMDHFDIASAVLVGASNGGRIAINFALTYPERVRGLVLVGAAVDGFVNPPEIDAQWQAIDEAYEQGDIPRAVELTLHMWIDGPHRTPDQVDTVVRERAGVMVEHLYRIPDETDLGTEQPLTDPLPITRLGSIMAPTLVLQGDQDVAYHLSLSEKIAADISHATHTLIANASHLPNMEQPDTFNALLAEFLDTL